MEPLGISSNAASVEAEGMKSAFVGTGSGLVRSISLELSVHIDDGKMRDILTAGSLARAHLSSLKREREGILLRRFDQVIMHCTSVSSSDAP